MSIVLGGGVALAAAHGFVFDIDGTLALPDKRAGAYVPLPGAREVLADLRSRGIPFLVLTNNSVHTPDSCAVALGEAGFDLVPGDIVTPSVVAAAYFVRRNMRRVLSIGRDGMRLPLQQAGIEVLAPDHPDLRADAVYIGYHRDFTIMDIEAACSVVAGGGALFSSSSAAFFATRAGRTIAAERAITAAVSAITGKRPVILGKPSLHALRYAARRLGVAVAELAVVGDDPGLEIAMARKGGALAVGVGTGVASAADFMRPPPDMRPHLFIDGIAGLLPVVAGR